MHGGLCTSRIRWLSSRERTSGNELVAQQIARVTINKRRESPRLARFASPRLVSMANRRDRIKFYDDQWQKKITADGAASNLRPAHYICSLHALIIYKTFLLSSTNDVNCWIFFRADDTPFYCLFRDFTNFSQKSFANSSILREMWTNRN